MSPFSLAIRAECRLGLFLSVVSSMVRIFQQARFIIFLPVSVGGEPFLKAGFAAAGKMTVDRDLPTELQGDELCFDHLFYVPSPRGAWSILVLLGDAFMYGFTSDDHSPN